MLENVKLSPEEVLNYIEMPEAASRALNELLDQVAELEATVESLENTTSDLETCYNDLEDIINQDRVNYDDIIAELKELSKKMYSSL
jgi:uncharacterized protein YoxC